MPNSSPTCRTCIGGRLKDQPESIDLFTNELRMRRRVKRWLSWVTLWSIHRLHPVINIAGASLPVVHRLMGTSPLLSRLCIGIHATFVAEHVIPELIRRGFVSSSYGLRGATWGRRPRPPVRAIFDGGWPRDDYARATGASGLSVELRDGM